MKDPQLLALLNNTKLQARDIALYNVIKRIIDDVEAAISREEEDTEGIWNDVVFAATNYTAYDYTTASVQTWTVTSPNQIIFKYMIIGKTLWVKFLVDSTTVTLGGGAVGAALRVSIPGIEFIAGTFAQHVRAVQAGVATDGVAQFNSNFIEFRLNIAGAQFVAGVTNTRIEFEGFGELV